MHVSEISSDKVDSPELALALGQKVKIKITELDIEKRRVNLSIKKADPNWKEVEENKDKPKTHSSSSKDEGPKRQTVEGCLLYTSPSPRDATLSRMPSSA